MSNPVAAGAGPPFELEGFRIGDVLGEGGAGTVYAATRDDGTAVAIKVLRADLALTETEVRRFLTEATLMERLEHPSIVSVLRSGRVADGRPYLVMPGLIGQTLAARLHRGRMPVSEAIACFTQLAEAVAVLHAAGIIHRDLKPENVFLVDGTRVVLLDFGIAKDSDSAPSTTTTEGRVRGTPAYMAPERFFGAAASFRSDIYELAVCLYEMLAGALPWGDPDDVGARLDPRGGDLPAPLWSVLRRALASTAEQRPGSVAELLAAVVAAANAAPESGERQTLTLDGSAMVVVASPSVRVTVSRVRPSTIAAAIAIASIVMAAAVVIALRSRTDRPRLATSPAARAGEPPHRFCDQVAPRPSFCADFEQAGDFRDGFDNAGRLPDPGELGGGTIRASASTVHTGARSAELTIPALASAENNASAALIVELPAPIRYAIVTMSLRIDTERFAGERAVAVLASVSFGQAGAINLSRKQAGTQLSIYEGKTITDKTLLAPQIAVGEWKTVKVMIHNYAVGPDGRGDVIVFVDGLAAKLPLPRSLQTTDIRPRLSVGVLAARGPMEPLRINVDDVEVSQWDGPPDAELHR